MIDQSIIKENFARMSDTELVNLAENEGHDLTPEALSILQQEFLARRLDMAIFGLVEENKITQKEKEIEKAQAKGEDSYLRSVWVYAFEEKEAGKTDNEIRTGIIDKGLTEEEADEMIRSLENKVKEFMHAHDTQIWVGGFICLAGLGVTLWSFSAAYAASGRFYVIAYGAIIVGAIRFFRGISNRAKYKKLLAKILAEQKN